MSHIFYNPLWKVVKRLALWAWDTGFTFPEMVYISGGPILPSKLVVTCCLKMSSWECLLCLELNPHVKARLSCAWLELCSWNCDTSRLPFIQLSSLPPVELLWGWTCHRYRWLEMSPHNIGSFNVWIVGGGKKSGLGRWIAQHAHDSAELGYLHRNSLHDALVSKRRVCFWDLVVGIMPRRCMMGSVLFGFCPTTVL